MTRKGVMSADETREHAPNADPLILSYDEEELLPAVSGAKVRADTRAGLECPAPAPRSPISRRDASSAVPPPLPVTSEFCFGGNSGAMAGPTMRARRRCLNG
jgi:hypothetical protein